MFALVQYYLPEELANTKPATWDMKSETLKKIKMRTATVEVLDNHDRPVVPKGPSVGLLLLEILSWSIVYLIVFQRWFAPFVRKQLLNSRFGQGPTVIREGFFLRSMLDEATLSFTLALHHLLSGGMMFAGYMLQQPALWLHGIAVEMGYEVVDTLAILSNGWPYSTARSKVMKIVPLLHHVPTLLLIPVIVRLGYHSNQDVQTLGWSLIGAGGIGFLSEGLKKVLDKDERPYAWLLIHLANATVMFLCRMVAFSKSSIGALQTLKRDLRASHLYGICLLGLASLMLFNAAIMLTYLWKLVRHGGSMAARASPRIFANFEKGSPQKVQ